jgi:hypothetical protein
MSRRVCEGEALLACRLVVKSPFVPFRPRKDRHSYTASLNQMLLVPHLLPLPLAD